MTTTVVQSVIERSEDIHIAKKARLSRDQTSFKFPSYENIHASIEKIRNIGLLDLQRKRKLCLVLDLDHTLLHTVNVDGLSKEEKRKLKDNCLNDLYEWESMGVKFVTKLRPFVRKFLEEASKKFELYVYTMGLRDYALQMAEFLDPDRVYFGSRIMSREDCMVRGLKGLDIIPVYESGVLILDDTKAVWKKHVGNLMEINKYDYFGGRGSFLEEGRDESEITGTLSCALKLIGMLHSFYYDWYRVHDVRKLLKTLREINGEV